MTERSTSTAVYVRVSTTKASQKDSPEHQRGICEEKAKTLQLAICRVYEDRDSGTSIVGRSEIRQLIRDARAGYFANVIFASLSRFSRDTLDSLHLKRMLVDALGLRLISLEEGYDSAKDQDELKFQILSAVNQKLSEQISLSSKRGIRQSAKKGNFTGSVSPYGYNKALIDGRKTLLPDPTKQQIVELIYTLYTVRSMGEKAIVCYLNDQGIPASKGGRWGLSSVQRILTNEVYVGENVFGKYEVKKVYLDLDNMADRSNKQVRRDELTWERSGFRTHEPLVSDEVFRLAQQIRLLRGGGKRGGVRNRVNVFAGFMFCEHCGAAMVCLKTKAIQANGKAYRYLTCSVRRRQGEGACSNKIWLAYEPLKEKVLEQLSKRIAKRIDPVRLTERMMQNIPECVGSSRLTPGDANRKSEMYSVHGATHMTQKLTESFSQLVQLRFSSVDELRLILMKLIRRMTVDCTGRILLYSKLAAIEMDE